MTPTKKQQNLDAFNYKRMCWLCRFNQFLFHFFQWQPFMGITQEKGGGVMVMERKVDHWKSQRYCR